MTLTQTSRADLIAVHTIDSAPPRPHSARRRFMQRLGFACLVWTLGIGAAGHASAGQAQDEAAVRALGDTFAKAFVQKNAELPASLFAEDGTFVTPRGDFLQGRVAMVKDFGPEAEPGVNGKTEAAVLHHRDRLIKPDVAGGGAPPPDHK